MKQILNDIICRKEYILLSSCILTVVILSYELQGQTLGYGLIENNQFSYVNVVEDNGIKNLKQYEINEGSTPYITRVNPSSLNTYLPFAWKLKKDTFYNLMGRGRYPSNNYIVGRIQFYPVEQMDSIKIANYLEQFKAKFSSQKDLEKASAKKALEKALKIKSISVDPLEHRFMEYYFEQDALEKATKNLSYDFFFIEDHILFFTRANEDFTIWKAHLIKDDKIRAKISLDWIELVTYTSNNFYTSPFNDSWVENAKVPSGKKHIFQSIQDQEFFNGHFTVFQQGKNLFLLNTDLGSIYHIGEKSINKIGQLQQYKGSRTKDLMNYPNWIFGQRIFIEDKDKEQLIILKYHVEQLRKDLPFPKIKIIETEEKLKELLKFLD